MRVEFELNGQRYQGHLLARGERRARLGWREEDVPPDLSTQVTTLPTRPGWRSLLLPISGPNAAVIYPIPKTVIAATTDRKALGVGTADLAVKLGEFIHQQNWQGCLQVLCSHRGRFHGQREAELHQAGVHLRQIAFFLGAGHSAAKRIGVSDIAIVTVAEPRQAILLIEIEECKTGTKPKTVIGDALLPVIADRVDVLYDNGVCSSIDLRGASIWVGYHPRDSHDTARTDKLSVKLNDFARSSVADGGPARISIRLFNESESRLFDSLFSAAQQLLTTWTRTSARNYEAT